MHAFEVERQLGLCECIQNLYAWIQSSSQVLRDRNEGRWLAKPMAQDSPYTAMIAPLNRYARVAMGQKPNSHYSTEKHGPSLSWLLIHLKGMGILPRTGDYKMNTLRISIGRLGSQRGK